MIDADDEIDGPPETILMMGFVFTLSGFVLVYEIWTMANSKTFLSGGGLFASLGILVALLGLIFLNDYRKYRERKSKQTVLTGFTR